MGVGLGCFPFGFLFWSWKVSHAIWFLLCQPTLVAELLKNLKAVSLHLVLLLLYMSLLPIKPCLQNCSTHLDARKGSSEMENNLISTRSFSPVETKLIETVVQFLLRWMDSFWNWVYFWFHPFSCFLSKKRTKKHKTPKETNKQKKNEDKAKLFLRALNKTALPTGIGWEWLWFSLVPGSERVNACFSLWYLLVAAHVVISPRPCAFCSQINAG